MNTVFEFAFISLYLSISSPQKTVSAMASEDQIEVTGQASVLDLADENILINYCLQSKIASL